MNKGSKVEDKVLLAKVVATKGLKGELKLKSFTEDPLSIVDFDVFNEKGISFEILSAYMHKNTVIVKIAGIDSIEKAEKLIGDSLFANRSDLPETEEDSFYYVDLIGLDVLNLRDEKVGVVSAVHNYGAGDFLDIKNLDGTSNLIMFTKENVPDIEISKGYIRISEINYIDIKEEE